MSSNSLPSETIAVLLGGNSAEREISLQSGQAIAEAARAAGLQVREVDTAQTNWMQQLDDVALAFIALHGPGGEDGSMQGALQTLGVPYTGSDVLGSALAMDKQRSKELWQGIGLATPGFAILHTASDWQAVIDRFSKVFVKPACEGSSIGMSIADSAESLHDAYLLASEFGGQVLAEEFVEGQEYTVAILGEEALPSIRLETDNAFYDYEAKYLSDDTRYICPSELDDDQEREIRELSLRAFATLGCSVWGRVDVMRNGSGQFQVLEVNTVPGMTSHSLVPIAAAQAGMAMPELIQRIIALSLQERV